MTDEQMISRIKNLIKASGQKRRGERSNRDRAAKELLDAFETFIEKDCDQGSDCPCYQSGFNSESHYSSVME